MLAFKPGGSGATGISPTSPSLKAAVSSNKAPASTAAAPVAAPASAPVVTPAEAAAAPSKATASSQEAPDWHALMRTLPLRGLAQQLAFQTELQEWRDTPDAVLVTITTAMSQLATTDGIARLGEALKAHYGKAVRVQLGDGKASHTVAKVDAQIYEQKKLNAEEQMAKDPFLQELEREFGAKVVTGSVRPI